MKHLSAEQEARGPANVRKLFNSNKPRKERPDFQLPVINEDEQTYINIYGRTNIKRKEKARAQLMSSSFFFSCLSQILCAFY